MNKPTGKAGNRKIIIVIAVIVAAIAAFGITLVSIGGGSDRGHGQAEDHGHSHD